MNNFKFKLRALRKSNKLTQRELSKILGVSYTTIEMYELGERLPKYDILIKICNFFNVTPNDLIDL